MKEQTRRVEECEPEVKEREPGAEELDAEVERAVREIIASHLLSMKPNRVRYFRRPLQEMRRHLFHR